jgi:hypothetical protein
MTDWKSPGEPPTLEVRSDRVSGPDISGMMNAREGISINATVETLSEYGFKPTRRNGP